MTTPVMTEYSAMFEYVLGIVTKFISDQESMYGNTSVDEMYNEGSWMFNFFTINPKRLAVRSVQTEIDGMLSDVSGESESKPFNAPLARIQGLYATLYAASGKTFMSVLRDNIIESIAEMNGGNNSKSAVKNLITVLFNKYPFLVISIIGSSTFSNKCLHARRQRKIGTPGM